MTINTSIKNYQRGGGGRRLQVESSTTIQSRVRLSSKYLWLIGIGACVFQVAISFRGLHLMNHVESSSSHHESPILRPQNTAHTDSKSEVDARRKSIDVFPIHQLSVKQVHNLTKENVVATSPYAYSFIVGSIHEDRIAYKGFLWNVLLAVQMLKRLGSIADFVVFMQLAPDSQRKDIPEDDLKLLNSLGVHIIELSKPSRVAFLDLMFEKFQALQLVQYRRIMYLDSDVLPISNLDYLFLLSDPDDLSLPTILQPNVMQASGGEPANGGLFMMQPQADAFDRLQKIIQRQQDEGKLLKYPHFHNYRGWGHNFRESGDEWHGAKMNNTIWKFHGGFADQGLLYYFFRFEIQEASAIIGSHIENWTRGPVTPKASKDSHSHIPVIKSTYEDGILLSYSNLTLRSPTCQPKNRNKWTHFCYPPYRDIFHFTGKLKPWQNSLNDRFLATNLPEPTTRDKSRLWFRELYRLNKRFQMGLDFKNWNLKYLPGLKESPLGYLPLNADNHHRIFGRNITVELQTQEN